MKSIRTFAIGIIAILLSSCSPAHKDVIETFQLSGTSWDDLLYTEFQRESSFYDEYSFHFNVARTPEEEARQIENSIARKVDAIVVNPYNVDVLGPVINKAFDSGISVVLVGQKSNSIKYSAYVGTDNQELGRIAAEYIVSRLPAGGNIIVIEAYRDAPFYKDRYESFMHTISHSPQINIVASFDAAWDRERAHRGMDSLKTVLGDTKVDLVFAFGDDMICGAIDSENYSDAIYVGADGINGIGESAVVSGQLDATFSNPTGGEAAIRTAVSILKGVNVDRDVIMHSWLIDKNNVDMFMFSCNTLTVSRQRIDMLTRELGRSKSRSRAEIIVVILMMIALLWSIIQTRILLERFMKSESRFAQTRREALRELMSKDEKTDESLADPFSDSAFINEFCRSVEKNLDNPGLSVEDISSDLGVSRAQLYRKIKQDTGSTPGELLQSIRLEKASDMLKNTQMTVSEIAYAVGFSSPSYFSKCYKDKFGTSPSELRS